MIGVYIDIENLQSIDYLTKALDIIEQNFDQNLKYVKAYANWNIPALEKKRTFCLNKGIVCHQTKSPNKKNASDIELMLDVYEHLDELTTIIVVSDDSDFTCLSEKILSKNKQCINIRVKPCKYEHLYSKVIYLNEDAQDNLSDGEDTPIPIKMLYQDITTLKSTLDDTIADTKKSCFDSLESTLDKLRENDAKLDNLSLKFNSLKNDVNNIINLISKKHTSLKQNNQSKTAKATIADKMNLKQIPKDKKTLRKLREEICCILRKKDKNKVNIQINDLFIFLKNNGLAFLQKFNITSVEDLRAFLVYIHIPISKKGNVVI